MGPGPGVAGVGFVPPIARRAAAGPLCARQPGGMLRAAAPVLGGGRRQLSHLPHPLERHAGGLGTRQHAADQRRAIAGIAPGRAGASELKNVKDPQQGTCHPFVIIQGVS